MPVPGSGNDRARARLNVAGPAGDRHRVASSSFSADPTLPSPDAVPTGADQVGRMFSPGRRRAPHPAQLCSRRWCGCRRAHG
jgi:hypothetical protein